MYIGRKLLNLLPVIGEGEEEGTAAFEVQSSTTVAIILT